MATPLSVPGSLGSFYEEKQLSLGAVPSTRGTSWSQARNDYCRAQSAGHRLLHPRDQACYQDLGPDYFDRLNPEGLRRRLTKRLEGLGFKVTLVPLAQVA